MMQKYLFILGLWVLGSVLVDCTSTTIRHEATQNPLTQAASTSTTLPTSTPIITNTITKPTIIAGEETTENLPPNTPTSLFINSTATFTPRPTPLTMEQPVGCSNSQFPNLLNTEGGISGALGLVIRNLSESSFSDGSHAQASLLGGMPLQERVLLSPRHNIREIGFSPDGRWFAYQGKSNEVEGQPPDPFINLLSVQGELLITPIPFQEGETNGYWFGSWINNELILLLYDLPPEIEGESGHTFAILNPFTGERLQGILENLSGWNPFTTPYFSPDLTRVVFIRSGHQNNTIVLWDLEQGKELWHQPFISDVHLYEIGLGLMSDFGKTVMWSFDSYAFIYSGWDQGEYMTYIVSRDGELTVLQKTPDPQGGIIYEGAWSPNGRYIVYINDHFDTNMQVWSKSIMLYDFALNQIIELCTGLKGVTEVIWSPNSDQIAFMTQVESGFQLLILNIYTGEVVSIGEVQNFLAAKWLEDETWLDRE